MLIYNCQKEIGNKNERRTKIMMNLKQALEQGYKMADMKYQRGYVSRKVNREEQEVHVAGGNRKGQLYVLVPCFTSTQYCYRLYLTR